MDFERLAAFRAVAKLGGFSRAAFELHKTQPAVSQAVAALERELGEALFLRQGRQVRLTEAGRILAEHADESFGALQAARERIANLRGLRGGVLRLGASDTTACYVLPPVFARFRQRHPAVELDLDNRPSPGIVERVASGDLDVGVVTLPIGHRDLERHKLVTEPLVVREDVAVCAADHRLARKRRVALRDLLEHPLLLLHRGTATRAFIDEQLAADPDLPAPKVAMEMGSVEVIKRLVELGFGVSIIPRAALAREIESSTPSLAALSIFPRKIWRSIGLVQRREQPRAPTPHAAQAFIRIARDTLKRHSR